MSHDIHASWATTELARHFQLTPADCFHVAPPAGVSVYASREGRTKWPFADGVIALQTPNSSFKIAVEFKRTNEGSHGILTALGQSIAYINKGYNGAILVLPREYASHPNPGPYTASVLDRAVGKPNIGVFTYSEPDTTLPSPFTGKLQCVRSLQVDAVPPVVTIGLAGITETQWMHVREGSTTPSAFFNFLELSKSLRSQGTREPRVQILEHLTNAVRRIDPDADPLKYLSNSTGDSFRDKAWRHFWFRYVFTTEVMPLWRGATPSYSANATATRIKQADGIKPMVFFVTRSTSIKRTLVDRLNAGSITEDEAWEEYAQNVRKRAHSYREDID